MMNYQENGQTGLLVARMRFDKPPQFLDFDRIMSRDPRVPHSKNTELGDRNSEKAGLPTELHIKWWNPKGDYGKRQKGTQLTGIAAIPKMLTTKGYLLVGHHFGFQGRDETINGYIAGLYEHNSVTPKREMTLISVGDPLKGAHYKSIDDFMRHTGLAATHFPEETTQLDEKVQEALVFASEHQITDYGIFAGAALIKADLVGFRYD